MRKYLIFQDDLELHDYNVPERVQAFINAAHDQVIISYVKLQYSSVIML